MKEIIFTALITMLFFAPQAISQEYKIIYFNSDWKICKKLEAEYYREINLDLNNKPIGKIKDFFITGELQWEGTLSYFDEKDNSKDVIEGVSRWYHKNGQKSKEATYINGLEEGITTYWSENGLKTNETNFKNGYPDGLMLEFHESGQIFQIFNFANRELNIKSYIECDEFNNCEKIFYEGFVSTENYNNWPLINNNEYQSKIEEQNGLLMKTKIDRSFLQTINVPIEFTNDFSIETTINFVTGDINSGHGLIWGFKDWDNYNYFYISANGYLTLGRTIEGFKIENLPWTKSNYININNQKNKIKLLKEGENTYYSINGNLIHSEKFYSFRGNYIGFNILSGTKEISLETIMVKQSIEVEESFPNTNKSKKSIWKGNGTGFFINTTGYIATNYHVISNAQEIEIEFIRNGKREIFKGTVIQSDEQNDLAIIKIEDALFLPYQTIPYNFKTTTSDVGTNVFALGYPMALTIMGSEIKFTDGKISSKTGFKGNISTYQTTTPIQPGNSGGPLFDFDGNLIGINSAILSPDIADNVSYSIKSNYLKNLIEVLPNTFQLPTDQNIINYSLTEKIKILSEYVVLIKIK
jgi:S1-C subfamily serine protease/antitoxin component YwqK of YwqJK toxin-antitoxin module